MEDLNSANRKPHKLMLTNRRTCSISGVNDVLSFDVNEILLETEQGMLMIKGTELHVSRLSLDKGEVDVAVRQRGIAACQIVQIMWRDTCRLYGHL